VWLAPLLKPTIFALSIFFSHTLSLVMKNFYLSAALCWFCLMLSLLLKAQTPTEPSSNLHFTNIDGHSFSVNYTRGNGSSRLVIARKGGPVTSIPQNGKDYNHNLVFGRGDELNDGEFVVYDGTIAGFGLLGLAPNTEYHFAVFDYNGNGFGTQYLTQTFLNGQGSTLAPPAVQVSGLTASQLNGNSALLTWVNGSGTRRLLVMREGQPVQVNPIDLTTYNGRADFGAGSVLAPGTFAISFSNSAVSTSVEVTQLQPRTTYYVKAFEAVGNNGPVFQPAGAPELVFTTADWPTKPASSPTAGTHDGNVLNFSWINGNGSRRLIVVREGAPHTAVPTAGQDYIGNSDFSKATEIAPGHKVVYHTNVHQWMNMTGAKPATLYYIKIYESSGTGSRTSYRLTDAPNATFSTPHQPDQLPTDLNFAEVTPASVLLTYKKGSGTGRLVMARAGQPVDATPQDLISYNGNSALGSGSQLGNGNFILNFGDNSQTRVTALVPGTTYHYAVFEYNGSQARVFNPNPARASFTQPLRPTIPASGLGFSFPDVTRFRITWVAGNGQRRLVVIRKNNPVDFVPTDGQEYAASNDLSQAQDLGSGHYAILYNSSQVLDVAGLEPGTLYFIKIFEAAGTGTAVQYLTQGAPSGSFETIGAPQQGPQGHTVKKLNPTSALLRVSGGNGHGRLWVVRHAGAINAEPQDLQVYNATGTFGSVGARLGEDNFMVNQNNNEEAEITGLQPGETYHFAIFEYNGSNLRVYNRSKPYRFTITLPLSPDEPAGSAAFSLIEAGSLRLGFTPGNGTGRIVVARADEPVTAIPVNGTVYSANSQFSEAPNIAPGQKVIYNSGGGLVDVTGLLAGTTYHFAIYEYTLKNGSYFYLNSPLTTRQATLPIPGVPATHAQVSNIGATTANIGVTAGNGSSRLVVLRQGSAVTMVPNQYIAYSGSGSFSSAAPQSDGSRVIAATNATQVEVTGLMPGTTYYGAVFEMNGNDRPAYLTQNPATFRFTTIGAPAISASEAMVSDQLNTSLKLSWTNGSGQRRLVIMRAGQPVNGFPANNIRYPGNSFFGSGSIVPNANSSEPALNYVVYNGEGKEVIVTNLNPAIIYHFAIVEFNDFGNSILYQSGPLHTGTASPAVPLPLILDFFKVTLQQDKPLLQWATLQEQHTANFYVEARMGNESFATIATIPAAGFSNSQRLYNYQHPATQQGIIQYRLRMSDKDGTFTYSQVVQVEIRHKEKTWWQLSGNTLMLNLGTMPASAIQARLYDGNGRLLRHAVARQPMVQINLAGLPKGIYHVVWYDDGKQKSIIIHY